MHFTRRQFLISAVGCGLSMTLGRPLAFGADSAGKIPIGFQLYTVRGEFARDVPGTLQTLGEIGYKAVEFWGYGGTPKVYEKYSATELRKMLDDSDLKCCGIHLQLQAIDKEHLPITIQNGHTLGLEYLNVAAAQEKMGSEKGIADLAERLKTAAAECRPHKMIVGYHAHPFDFAKINGRFAWDLLFSQLPAEINMQMDVGNCLSGNGDPIAMLRKFPGRTRSIHIKEHEDKTFDSDFYKEVFHLCETSCGTKWYIVEMGSALGNGFDIPRQALAKLHKLGR